MTINDAKKKCKKIAQFKLILWVEQNFKKDSVQIEFLSEREALVIDRFDERMQIIYSSDSGVTYKFIENN